MEDRGQWVEAEEAGGAARRCVAGGHGRILVSLLRSYDNFFLSISNSGYKNNT